MALLAPLGQPFGRASQTIIGPALGPNPLVQGLGGLAAFGIRKFQKNKQEELEDADRAALGQLGNAPPGQLTDEQTAKGFADVISNFGSTKFKGIADQIFAQQLARQADPTGQLQREANLGLTRARTTAAGAVDPQRPVVVGEGDVLFSATGKELAKGQPKAASPSQQLSQKKLDAINALEEREKNGTLLPAEKTLLNKARLGGGGINIDLSSGQLLTAATSLRKEFNTDQRVEDFRILAPKFKNMLSFLNRSKKSGQKGPTDIALSKTFQKLTDLMSSVREGEYETTFRGQNLLQKLRGGILRLKEGGEGITPEFRQELVDTARLMFEDGKFFFNQAIEEKGSVADAFNIPRGQILGNIKPFDIVNTEKEFADIFGIEQAATPIDRNTLTEQDLDNPNLTIEQMESLLKKR
jgi:hypothetical protein